MPVRVGQPSRRPRAAKCTVGCFVIVLDGNLYDACMLCALSSCALPPHGGVLTDHVGS
jgi:hypothetical protein